jgi:hypothetical protein
MNRVRQFHSNQFKLVEDEGPAIEDAFQQLFTTEMNDFFRLSLNLTADVEQAGSCVILAMRDCFDGGFVLISKELARVWARRAVIRNAIRLVLGANHAIPIALLNESGPSLHLQPTEYPIEALCNSPAILDLPNLDRLAFVICVLERYSILDCAMLLSRSPKDVNDARGRAITRVVSAEERNRCGETTASRTILCQGGCGEGELDASCGALLD